MKIYLLDRRVKISLLDFDAIKRYAQKIIMVESDVDIIKGSVIYDAKSIMAILALGTLDDIYVEIYSDDQEEIKRFRELMEEFKA